MPIILKQSRELEMMRRAGSVARRVIDVMRAAVRPGVQTWQLDAIAAAEIEKWGAVSHSKDYPTFRPGEGYPGYTCISVNEEVVHGVPGARQLNEGDVVTLDSSLVLHGWHGSSAESIAVGAVHPETQRLLDVGKQALDLAIGLVMPTERWSNIAGQIQRFVEGHGYNLVREFVGHGIGRSHIEDPKVCHFLHSSVIRGDFKLRPGMTFTIEPIVVAGKRSVEMMPDNWTVVTMDGAWGVHFRHMIAVTSTGAAVLDE